jgi:hypothetical protein
MEEMERGILHNKKCGSAFCLLPFAGSDLPEQALGWFSISYGTEFSCIPTVQISVGLKSYKKIQLYSLGTCS